MSDRPPKGSPDELREVAERYARRQASGTAAGRSAADRYSLLQPDVWQTVQERQRALLTMLRAEGWWDLERRRGVEVGCGMGGNLLELLRLGFRPEHLVGLELLPQRLEQARALLPARLPLHLGDATRAPIEPGSCDLVLQATVFSSLLDDAFQAELAAAMWRWVKPGGAVLWYDFTVDNPRNPDVRGVTVARVRQLFPQAQLLHSRRVTLAPPLARLACHWHPGLYPLLNALPLLRTHRLLWLGKAV